MGIIHTLPLHEAQKIAAGEVVERPSNIVKELIENSLDAGATTITLYIENGGKDLIRCIDNGSGMSPEDARKSLEHHATSKLRAIEDLEHIQTFGFRGEALSSISAISSMVLTTRMAQYQEGTTLVIQGGAIEKEAIIAQAPGTDIVIKNLFFNVPARKKFLKTRETEWRSIYTMVQALALAHCNVAFRLYHDGIAALTTHATESLSERVSQIFDRSFAEHFLACEPQHKNALVVKGGIGNHQYQRYDRGLQFFFVNNRWIKNYKLGQAFMKGFQHVMPPGKYPAGIIFIDIPPHEVDINVHPRKEDVVFLHPRLIEITIEELVRKRLEDQTAGHISPIHVTDMHTPMVTHLYKGPIYHDKLRDKPYQTPRDFLPVGQVPCQVAEQTFTIVEPSLPRQTVIEAQSERYNIIGQYHKTYILLDHPEGMVVVDQHAAHECILYEQLSKKGDVVNRVQLLFPEVIHIEQPQQHIILSNIDELHSLGINLELIGPTSIAITHTPLSLKNYPLNDLIRDLMKWLNNEENVLDKSLWHTALRKKMHAMMACKAAVKAGDELSLKEMEGLLRSLYDTQHRLTCPHGRPTTWIISLYEIEKSFKRTR